MSSSAAAQPPWLSLPVRATKSASKSRRRGLVASVGGGVRYGLLNEVLPERGYLLGRSVLNMSVGVTQILGFGVGGLLVTALSARGTLLGAAVLDLFAAGALGMLAGDTATGRFVPARWRQRLGSPLRLLLAAPYLVFALRPALPVAVAAVVLASVGYGAGLLLQERLVELTPAGARGQALGLATSGMLTMQGVGAALAGSVAEVFSAGTAMAVLAAASVTVTLLLAPGLRAGSQGLRPTAP